eukprot:742852_1
MDFSSVKFRGLFASSTQSQSENDTQAPTLFSISFESLPSTDIVSNLEEKSNIFDTSTTKRKRKLSENNDDNESDDNDIIILIPKQKKRKLDNTTLQKNAFEYLQNNSIKKCEENKLKQKKKEETKNQCKEEI